jgi:hypothetical protein
MLPGSLLFQESSCLELEIRGSLSSILKDRSEDPPYRSVELRCLLGADSAQMLQAGLKTRGHFRKTYCAFPPLRLRVDAASSAGTPFEGQGKLKLVTHCNSRKPELEENLIEEYLLYRAYNLITDSSFRVRLAHVRYVDTGKKADSIYRYAFLIEPEEAMAARLGGKLLEVSQVRMHQTDSLLSTLMSLFEFMAGNTDWSVPGLHNVVLVRTDYARPPLSIPYDLDWSGAVMAPYAVPAPQLGLNSVRERLFRGFCVEDALLEAAIRRFQQRKEAIYSLYRETGLLSPEKAQETLGYFDEFYEIINDPAKVKRHIGLECRPER